VATPHQTLSHYLAARSTHSLTHWRTTDATTSDVTSRSTAILDSVELRHQRGRTDGRTDCVDNSAGSSVGPHTSCTALSARHTAPQCSLARSVRHGRPLRSHSLPPGRCVPRGSARGRSRIFKIGMDVHFTQISIPLTSVHIYTHTHSLSLSSSPLAFPAASFPTVKRLLSGNCKDDMNAVSKAVVVRYVQCRKLKMSETPTSTLWGARTLVVLPAGRARGFRNPLRPHPRGRWTP